MSNNVCTAQSNPDLVKPTGNQERIHHYLDLLIGTVPNPRNPSRAGSVDQESGHTSEEALFPRNSEGPSPSPT